MMELAGSRPVIHRCCKMRGYVGYLSTDERSVAVPEQITSPFAGLTADC